MDPTKQNKKWSQEQIKNRCSVKAPVGAPEYGATVHIIPIFAGGISEGGYGDKILWDVRMFRQGAVEPASADKNSLIAVGCSEDDAEAIISQIGNTTDFLRRTYPVMKPGMERKPGLLRWVP